METPIRVWGRLVMKIYYKYVDARGLDILRNSRIKVSDISLTNDPFEVLPRLDYPTDEEFWCAEFDRRTEYDPVFFPAKVAKQTTPQKYERQRRQYARDQIVRRPKALRESPQRLRHGYAQKVGFVCLTTKPDDIVMWSHYADSHKGIVVEFDADHVFFVNFVDTNGNKLRVIPIDYRDSRPVLKFGEPFRMELLACKSVVWKYEDEIRVLFHRDFCTEEGSDVFFPVPSDCITGVILGARTTSQVCAEIAQLNLVKWNGSLHCVFRSNRPLIPILAGH